MLVVRVSNINITTSTTKGVTVAPFFLTVYGPCQKKKINFIFMGWRVWTTRPGSGASLFELDIFLPQGTVGDRVAGLFGGTSNS